MALDLSTPIEKSEHLQKVSEEILRMEGKCKPDTMAFASCKQLTDEEERRVQSIRKGTRSYSWDPGTDRSATTDATDWYLYNRELAWFSLSAVRNLTREGAEIFRFTKEGVMGGDKAAFEKAWGKMPSFVTIAIARVALSVNPALDALNLVRPNAMVWLGERHPEIFESMNAWVEAQTEKNLVGEEEQNSETKS